MRKGDILEVSDRKPQDIAPIARSARGMERLLSEGSSAARAACKEFTRTGTGAEPRRYVYDGSDPVQVQFVAGGSSGAQKYAGRAVAVQMRLLPKLQDTIVQAHGCGIRFAGVGGGQVAASRGVVVELRRDAPPCKGLLDWQPAPLTSN